MSQHYLVIVALGDSLTTGYQHPSEDNPAGLEYPYPRILQLLMWKEITKLKIDLNPVVENEGIVGESTKGMLRRFDSTIPSLKPDYVIIWSGINDLTSGVSADAVVSNLKEIYKKTRAINATPIACTIAPIVSVPKVIEIILTCNKKIEELAKSENIQLIDLYKTLSNKEGQLRAEYNNDGIHLNVKGYTKVATTIFEEAVKPIIKKLKFL